MMQQWNKICRTDDHIDFRESDDTFLTRITSSKEMTNDCCSISFFKLANLWSYEKRHKQVKFILICFHEYIDDSKNYFTN